MRSKLFAGALASTAACAITGGAQAAPIQVLRNNMLVTVDSATPATALSSTAISGLGAGQTLNGFDYRPANARLLYGVSNTGQVYAINGRTGGAAAIGAPIAAAATAAGVGVGLDFNPTVDRIRFVTTGGTDLRLNQVAGALAATDGMLMYAGIDANAGQVPTVAGSAYTNSVRRRDHDDALQYRHAWRQCAGAARHARQRQCQPQYGHPVHRRRDRRGRRRTRSASTSRPTGPLMRR